jgi:AP-1 complex subunit beta-1
MSPTAGSPRPVPVNDLLGDLMGLDVSSDGGPGPESPAFRATPTKPVLLQAANAQGLQISGQMVRRNGQILYDLTFENQGTVPLDGFMIQFNKNTFGLAAGSPLQVS